MRLRSQSAHLLACVCYTFHTPDLIFHHLGIMRREGSGGRSRSLDRGRMSGEVRGSRDGSFRTAQSFNGSAEALTGVQVAIYQLRMSSNRLCKETGWTRVGLVFGSKILQHRYGKSSFVLSNAWKTD